jgi:hypothetical protein
MTLLNLECKASAKVALVMVFLVTHTLFWNVRDWGDLTHLNSISIDGSAMYIFF